MKMNELLRKERNEQALALSSRRSNIEYWATRKESDPKQALERREIEEELGMTPQQLYVAAIRQATERINLPLGGAQSLGMEDYGYRHRVNSEDTDDNNSSKTDATSSDPAPGTQTRRRKVRVSGKKNNVTIVLNFVL